MRTESRIQTPRPAEPAEPSIVDLAAREVTGAEHVKGGCTTGYCRYWGTRVSCPRNPRW